MRLSAWGVIIRQKERKLFQVYINLSGGVSVSGVRPFAHSKNNVALRFLTFINFQGSQKPVMIRGSSPRIK